MKTLKQFIRLLHIHWIIARYGLDGVLMRLPAFSPFRVLLYFNPWHWFRKKSYTEGMALRKTLEALGPIFIKFGQALSTRPDVLPEDIILELSKLQDNVPPFAPEKALEMLEATYGQSAFDVFSEFNTTPLASASIAQVHAATLKTGEAVVVKILRPKIKRLIARDVSLLKRLAALTERYWPESRRFKPKAVVREFEQHLEDELDLQREAANASQLRRNFIDSPILYVPQIYWDYTHRNILVMERIHGIPITNIKALKKQGICLKTLAERGVEIFFTQVFRDCFFHADMHPGNIFVSRENPCNPQYISVDFGIMGTLNDADKRYLAENLLAFFNRDYRRIAVLHIESGWINRNTRVDAFESAIRTVAEPIFEKPLKDISFALLVLRLLQVARRFNMEVQPELVLLQKTLLAIEGLGRQLDPNLNLWETAKPFLEKWVKQQVGPRALLTHLKDNLPFLIEELPHMPKRLNELLLLHKKQQLYQLEQLKHPPAEQSTSSLKSALLSSALTLLGLFALHALHMIGG